MKQKIPTIEPQGARSIFLDNVIPFIREQVEAFEKAINHPQTPDPENVRLIADAGRRLLKQLEAARRNPPAILNHEAIAQSTDQDWLFAISKQARERAEQLTRADQQARIVEHSRALKSGDSFER